MGDGLDQTSEQKKDPPLQKPQGWGALRVFVFFGGFNVYELTSEELARLNMKCWFPLKYCNPYETARIIGL